MDRLLQLSIDKHIFTATIRKKYHLEWYRNIPSSSVPMSYSPFVRVSLVSWTESNTRLIFRDAHAFPVLGEWHVYCMLTINCSKIVYKAMQYIYVQLFQYLFFFISRSISEVLTSNQQYVGRLQIPISRHLMAGKMI